MSSSQDDQDDLVGHLEMTVPLVQMQLGLPGPAGPLPERSGTRIDGHGASMGIEHLVQGQAGLAIRCISALIDYLRFIAFIVSAIFSHVQARTGHLLADAEAC